MEDRVLKELADLGYNGPLLEKKQLQNALQEGPKSPDYTSVVSYLAKDLKVLCNIDEEVNAIMNPEDSITFLMELSSFLKELNCPYVSLTQGHISDRLQNIPDRLQLLDYLATELMAARILREKRPEKKIELKIQESPEAANLRKALTTLRFPKPPPNITVQQLFQKLTPTLETTTKKAGADLLGRPIFNGTLSDKQWHTLQETQKDLNNEYTIRREMLLKRLDCTIQSFEWSDKTKGKDELIEKIYAEKRRLLKVEPDIDLADLLAARDDLAIIEKTSNANVRKFTTSAINKVIIGQVPDRGGRTSEQAPPPPEMPSWQQRSSGPSGGRGGQQGRGGGRGGGRGDYQNRGRDGQHQHYQGQQQQNWGGNQYYEQQQSYGQQNYDQQQSYGYQQQQQQSFDSAGSFAGTEFRVRNKSGDRYGQGSRSFDSAGSFDSFGGRRSSSSRQDYRYESSEPKRFKNDYNSFQTNKTTYADQYVQESQHNRQYHPRGGGRGGGGRSNYNRGGGGHTYR